MFKPQYKQLINMDSSLLTCAKAGLLLQHNRLICVFSCRIFSERWYRYGSILFPHRFLLLAMLLCIASYEQSQIVDFTSTCPLISMEQCSTQLLKVLHKCCNMDVLGVLLIFLHSPLGAVRPQDRVYISVKSLAAVLQYLINMYIYIYIYIYMAWNKPKIC